MQVKTKPSSMMRILPFDERHLDFDYRSSTYIEIPSTSKCYLLAKFYVAQHLVSHHDLKSFEITDCTHDDDEDNEKKPELTIGLGRFNFVDFHGETLVAIHQAIGEPVGSYSVTQFTNLLIFVAGLNKEAILSRFCEDLIAANERTAKGKFTIFTWNVCSSYWNEEKRCTARPIESVILSEDIKNKLMADVERFLSTQTKKYYELHGIPYRRAYLFHGVPGAGKTSLIQALAGKLERNLCILQPSNPRLTDDSLRHAVAKAPSDSIIILEDIDSLFSKDRKSKVEKSPLTFSGLLNALDGVGDSNGQIFIMTTNLRWELDPALIRNGRVDMHVEFGYATEEQMRKMWVNFYPESTTEQSYEFSNKLKELLGNRMIVTAALQHYFVKHMRSSIQEALDDIAFIIEDIDERNSDNANLSTTSKTDDNNNEVQAAEGSEASNAASDETALATMENNPPPLVKQALSATDVHVHIHI